MDIAHLITHPEELNQDTLYDLRKLVAVHPYFHAARILFLKNLFLLHDNTFDLELRRAALLLPDRRALFNITQPNNTPDRAQTATQQVEANVSNIQHTTTHTQSDDITIRLLDNFLQTTTPKVSPTRRIKADPRTDYMAYLMQEEEDNQTSSAQQTPTPQADDRQELLMQGFIESQAKGITLSENPSIPESILEDPDELPAEENEEEKDVNQKELSETLAYIYIKQQKYTRAYEIISKVNSNATSSKNPYLKDQLRFLKKLALNERKKQQQS